MTIDMTKVFLIMRTDTAGVVESVIQARIDMLDGTECNNPAVSAEMAAERAHLMIVAGQLKEPA